MAFDEMFEGFRRAWVSSLQMQKEMFTQFAQHGPTIPLSTAGFSVEWVQKLQKRWQEFLVESLNRHREMVDSTYKGIIQMVERTSRLAEVKTPEDIRRLAEEARHSMFETFRDQSEAQLRDFQRNAEKWFEIIPTA